MQLWIPNAVVDERAGSTPEEVLSKQEAGVRKLEAGELSCRIIPALLAWHDKLDMCTFYR